MLILRALGLGDFLTGVPAYRALRAAHPEHEIVLAAPGVLAPLAALTGAVDRVLATGELQPVEWAGAPPEVAVDLHGNGPASHELVRALDAKRAMMFASEAAPDAEGPWWRDDEHEVHRWCRLLEWYGVPADPGALWLDRPSVMSRAPGAVVVHPGAASGSRRWPAERFAAVAAALAADGERVVITGSPAELGLARRVTLGAGLADDAVLAGRLGLAGMAALVAEASLVISNDTGVAHLAVAYGVPSVTLYGPVSPVLWGPPAGARQHVALWRGSGLRPGDPHGGEADPRLLLIRVDDVLGAVRPARSAHVPAGGGDAPGGFEQAQPGFGGGPAGSVNASLPSPGCESCARRGAEAGGGP